MKANDLLTGSTRVGTPVPSVVRSFSLALNRYSRR